MSAYPSSQPLSTVPLPAHARAALTQAGFKTVGHVLELRPSDLSKELGLPVDQALEIQKTLAAPASSAAAAPAAQAPMTAFDMLKVERSLAGIATLCGGIDAMLGDGVPLQKVTEFCGAPGMGKTQLSIQLAVDVGIPAPLGGVAGEAVYIDTEGSFVVERAKEIATATLEHLHRVADYSEQAAAVEAMTVEALLAGIHYFRVHDHVQQLAVMEVLPGFLAAHPKVKLIVVDSIAFHFRQEFADAGARTRILNGMGQNFQRLALHHGLAVVLINQMTTKVDRDNGASAGAAATGGSSRGHLVPALGESFAHLATHRVMLFWQNGARHATLFKSPSREETTVAYQVTASGLRDLAPAGRPRLAAPASASEDTQNTDDLDAKRPRRE